MALNLAGRVRRIVEALPEGASVTLPREVLVDWLEGSPEADRKGEAEAGPPIADLTVEDLAAAYDKAPSTIRQWLQDVPGVYRIGQELRISRKDWRRYLDTLPDRPPNGGEPEPEGSRGRRLSDWRAEV